MPRYPFSMMRNIVSCCWSIFFIHSHSLYVSEGFSSPYTNSIHANRNTFHKPIHSPPIHPNHSSSRTSTLHASQSTIPTWSEFSSLIPSLNTPNPHLTIDSALDPTKPTFSQTHPTLFRERHGWCPYSERVWLALEHKNIPYDTIQIDNTGPGVKPPYYPGGTTPQILWEDGKYQGESMELIRVLDSNTDYPTLSSSVLDAGVLFPETVVEDQIRQWKEIFPRGARPSSRAAFLFSWNGEPLSKSEFERVLRDTNDLLSSTSNEGPFFCGETFTAADIAWAPFLERYAAQLPCLHNDLQPNDPNTYPHLHQWYDAMQTRIPAYACRIKGSNASWRKVLGMAGFGNMGNVPTSMQRRMENCQSEEYTRVVCLTEEDHVRQRKLWKEYQSSAVGREYLAKEGPSMEAAAILVRNHEAILRDIAKRIKLDKDKGWKDVLPHESDVRMEQALRGVAYLLMKEDDEVTNNDSVVEVQDEMSSELLHDIGAMATFLDDRLCVPRDMGEMSAAAIKRIAARLG